MIEVFNSHVDRLALWLQIHSYSGIFLYTSQDIQYLVFWVTNALGNFLDKLNILIEWKKSVAKSISWLPELFLKLWNASVSTIFME